MMRSLYAGVSGLRNHQTRMDVIGNNIANVNTAGYKKSRVVFKDTLYQTVRGASSPTTTSGGTNPMGIGLGMTVASIDQIHTGAPTTTTNKLTDMAVDGNGYFVVGNAGSGGQLYYTRAGAFDFDAEGNLVSLANGYHVKGCNATATTTVDGSVITFTPDGAATDDISIKDFKTLAQKSTENMVISGNLNAATNYTESTNEWQTLSFTANPIGGVVGEQFTLTLDSNTTPLITVGSTGAATAANIEAGLEALTNVGAGNVEVTWDADLQRYDIKFINAQKQKDIPEISPPVYANLPFNGVGGIVVEATQGNTVGPIDEVQTLDLGTTEPTQGTFTLSYDGVHTAVLPFNETAANVQAALNAIPGLAGVTVTENAAHLYTITFPGALGDVPSLVLNPCLGTTATSAVDTLIEGEAPLSPVAVNEVQTLDLLTATAGTFTLTYPGGTVTDPIDFNADAATIQAELISKNPSLNQNITVTATAAPTTGVGAHGGTFTIEFNNGLGGQDINTMTFTKTGFAAGTGTISSTTQGQPPGNPAAADSLTITKDVVDSEGNQVSVSMRFFKYEVEPGSEPGVTPVVQPVTSWACDISLDPLFENQIPYNANADLRTIDFTAAPSVATAGDEKMTRIYNIEFDQNGNLKIPTANATGIATLSIDRMIPPPGTGTANMTIDIDFNDLSQTAGSNSAWVKSQDGYTKGDLTSYSIGVDGIITGVYDNGQKQSLAQVNLATFENPGGLQQLGGTIFQSTVNSGDAKIGMPGAVGKGKIVPGSLEMSNVDLSEEFTDMIVTQRGFQANSRIITTSDEMLQELVNLKR